MKRMFYELDHAHPAIAAMAIWGVLSALITLAMFASILEVL